jgi:hypothetical protein
MILSMRCLPGFDSRLPGLLAAIGFAALEGFDKLRLREHQDGFGHRQNYLTPFEANLH